MRENKPLRINYRGIFCYLGAGGIVKSGKEALKATREEIEQTLFSASEFSLYAVENQIRQGFLTAKCGERIGIAGTFVYESGRVHTIREITSLCIRIPHAVYGCAEEIYRRCFSENISSTLILSPPGEGKTTLLRDLCRIVSERTNLNILVSDERGELSAGNLGETSDCICFADKKTAFSAGIRAMRPDIIVTDELVGEDYSAVKRAIEGGIVVFASAHLKNYSSVVEKIFSTYVVLDGLGKIGKIYGAKGNELD